MSGRQESAKSVHSSSSHKPGSRGVRGAEAASYFKAPSSSMVLMRVCIKENICWVLSQSSSLPDLACMENCVSWASVLTGSALVDLSNCILNIFFKKS